MKVNLDENGYVREWALVGDNGGIDVPEPDDLEEFIFCATGYKVVDGLLQKDDTRDRAQRIENKRKLFGSSARLNASRSLTEAGCGTPALIFYSGSS